MKNVQTVPITIRIPVRAQQRLFEMAKACGYQPTHFAQLIFDAAFAARVGQERGDEPNDEDLDQMVRAVFVLAGQFDTLAIAKAVGISEPLAVRIVEAWRAEALQAGAPMAKAKAAQVGAAPWASIVQRLNAVPNVGTIGAISVATEPATPAAPPVKGPNGKPLAYPPDMIETIREGWAAGDPTSKIAKAIGKTRAALSMFASKNRDICPRRAKVDA